MNKTDAILIFRNTIYSLLYW